MNHNEIDNPQWWVSRWLELLDSYRFKKRLERGRNYAREGNVLKIDFQKQKAVALVQGSAPSPYEVIISLDLFSEQDWANVVETMSEKALFLAELLAGSMPSEIEKVFIANGLSLFPYNLSDVQSCCSCPDKANPCKHIAAVYYQLGDRFSEDPFVIFNLRGRSRDQILEALRHQRLKSPNAEAETIVNQPQKLGEANSEISLQDFWRYEEPLESSLLVIVPSGETKKLFEILGNLPLPHAEAEAIKQYLKQVYQNVSQSACANAFKT